MSNGEYYQMFLSQYRQATSENEKQSLWKQFIANVKSNQDNSEQPHFVASYIPTYKMTFTMAN